MHKTVQIRAAENELPSQGGRTQPMGSDEESGLKLGFKVAEVKHEASKTILNGLL